MSNAGKRTVIDRTPLSLTPAPGWRAIFILDPDERPGWCDQPLIAWGVFHHVERPVKGATGATVDRGNHIEGVIHNGTDFGSYPDSAESMGNFWHYRQIGDPDPTRDEVEVQQTRQARSARHGHA